MGGSSSSFLKSTDKRVALVMQKRKHIPLFDGDEYSTYLRPYLNPDEVEQILKLVNKSCKKEFPSPTVGYYIGFICFAAGGAILWFLSDFLSELGLIGVPYFVGIFCFSLWAFWYLNYRRMRRGAIKHVNVIVQELFKANHYSDRGIIKAQLETKTFRVGTPGSKNKKARRRNKRFYILAIYLGKGGSMPQSLSPAALKGAVDPTTGQPVNATEAAVDAPLLAAPDAPPATTPAVETAGAAPVHVGVVIPATAEAAAVTGVRAVYGPDVVKPDKKKKKDKKNKNKKGGGDGGDDDPSGGAGAAAATLATQPSAASMPSVAPSSGSGSTAPPSYRAVLAQPTPAPVPSPAERQTAVIRQSALPQDHIAYGVPAAASVPLHMRENMNQQHAAAPSHEAFVPAAQGLPPAQNLAPPPSVPPRPHSPARGPGGRPANIPAPPSRDPRFDDPDNRHTRLMSGLPPGVDPPAPHALDMVSNMATAGSRTTDVSDAISVAAPAPLRRVESVTTIVGEPMPTSQPSPVPDEAVNTVPIQMLMGSGMSSGLASHGGISTTSLMAPNVGGNGPVQTLPVGGKGRKSPRGGRSPRRSPRKSPRRGGGSNRSKK